MRIFLGVMMLWAVPLWAQATRSLLEEMLTAEQRAHPATVRTQYAVGNAFMVDGATVIAALHSVLTPGGIIADEIGVGFPRPPLNNIMQSRSIPIAQDPDHDLILLEIKDYRPQPTPAADADATPPASRCEARPVVPETHSVRPQPPAHIARKPIRINAKTFAFREHPRLNIVDDGPAGSR